MGKEKRLWIYLAVSLPFFVISICMVPKLLFAQGYKIRMQGRKNVIVTDSVVRLKDIAILSSATTAYDEPIVSLSKLEIMKSPNAGESTTLSANELLSILRRKGVKLSEIGYAIPRVISIKRAGRQLREDEIARAIARYLNKVDPESELEALYYSNKVIVPPGSIKLDVKYASGGAGARSSMFLVRAISSEKREEAKFLIRAKIAKWKEVPVAKRSIERGEIITAQDITRARLNINALPIDAAIDDTNLVGYKAKRQIRYGEVFRRSKLDIPPVVSAGDKVNLVFRSRLIEASASGVALESGLKGDNIKVRNESSKRVVVGRIVEPGIVRVMP